MGNKPRQFHNSIVEPTRFRQGGLTRLFRRLQERERVLQIEIEQLTSNLSKLPDGKTYKMVAIEIINSKGRLAEIESVLLYLIEHGEKYDDIPYAVLAQAARNKRRQASDDKSIYEEVAKCIKESVPLASVTPGSR